MKKQYPPRQLTPEQNAQLAEAFELGAQAAKEGRASTDYLPQFKQILYYHFKTSPSNLLAEYFKGHHSITDHGK